MVRHTTLSTQETHRSRTALICGLLFCLLTFCGGASAASKVYATVDPQQGTENDRYTLKVSCENCQNLPIPEFDESTDFETRYLGPETVIVNGRVSLSAVFILTPKKKGALKTPSAEVEVDGNKVRIDPISVTVSDTPATTSSQAEATITQSLNHETVYKGEQVINSVEILLSRSFIQPQLADEPLEKFWQEPLGEEEHKSKIVNGKQFESIIIRKAIFPLTAGKLEVPSRTLKGKIAIQRRQRFGFDMIDPFDSFFTPQELRDAAIPSNTVSLQVRELPAVPADFPLWGMSVPPVGVTELKAEMNEGSTKVGESRTLILTVTSLGNIAPLNEVVLPPSKQYRVYAESPKVENFENSGSLISRRTFKISIVPLRSGKLEIPEIALGYFNPQDGEYRIARSRAFALTGIGEEDDAKDDPARIEERTEPQGEQAAPQVDQREFEAEGFLKRVSDQISLPFAILMSCTLLFFSAGLWIVLRVGRAAGSRKALRKQIESAGSPQALEQALYKLLHERFALPTGAHTPEELKSHLRGTALSKQDLFVFGTLVDELSALQYGGSQVESSLPKLRQQLLELSEARLGK